jgi:hypothetical protein
MPAPDVATFQRVTRPSKTQDGLYAPGLRFGDPTGGRRPRGAGGFLQPDRGLTNRRLAMRTSQFLGSPYTSRQATYDLRRLKRKGLIRRLRKKHSYALTPMGRGIAVLFTKTYGRVLSPGLALFDPNLSDDLAR